MAEEVEVREVDGRPPGQRYAEADIYQARAYYCTGMFPMMIKIDEAVGLTPGTTERWRASKLPDGKDWDELKDKAQDRQLYAMAEVTMETPAQAAAAVTRLARMLRQVAEDALTMGELEDEQGHIVEYLYRRPGGEKVRVGGIRPTAAREVTEIARAVKVLSEMRDWEAEIQEAERRAHVAVQEALVKILKAIQLSSAQWERYNQVRARMEATGELPEEALALDA